MRCWGGKGWDAVRACATRAGALGAGGHHARDAHKRRGELKAARTCPGAAAANTGEGYLD